MNRCMGLIRHGGFEKIGLIVAESERLTVVLAGTVLVQCLLVFAGGIALILRPVVFWKFAMQCFHIIIPVGLCKNAGRSDRCINAIALDNAFVGNPFIFREPVSIDQ